MLPLRIKARPWHHKFSASDIFFDISIYVMVRITHSWMRVGWIKMIILLLLDVSIMSIHLDTSIRFWLHCVKCLWLELVRVYWMKVRLIIRRYMRVYVLIILVWKLSKILLPNGSGCHEIGIISSRCHQVLKVNLRGSLRGLIIIKLGLRVWNLRVDVLIIIHAD